MIESMIYGPPAVPVSRHMLRRPPLYCVVQPLFLHQPPDFERAVGVYYPHGHPVFCTSPLREFVHAFEMQASVKVVLPSLRR